MVNCQKLFFLRADNIKEKDALYEELFGPHKKVENTPTKKSKAISKIKTKTPQDLRRSKRSKHVAKELEGGDECDLDSTVKKKKDTTAKIVIEVIELERKGVSSSETKNFKCSDCDKDFVFHNSLLKHKKNKHSYSIYLCDICDKTFVYKDSVLRHKNTAHSEVKTQYLCTICSQTFKYKCNLRAHIIKFHPDEL